MAAAAGSAAGPKLTNAGFIGNLSAAAAIGGTASVVGGGSFANGAKTAAYGYLYNQSAEFAASEGWRRIEEMAQAMWGGAVEQPVRVAGDALPSRDTMANLSKGAKAVSTVTGISSGVMLLDGDVVKASFFGGVSVGAEGLSILLNPEPANTNQQLMGVGIDVITDKMIPDRVGPIKPFAKAGAQRLNDYYFEGK